MRTVTIGQSELFQQLLSVIRAADQLSAASVSGDVADITENVVNVLSRHVDEVVEDVASYVNGQCILYNETISTLKFYRDTKCPSAMLVLCDLDGYLEDFWVTVPD